MPVESATYIKDLNTSYPAGTEYKSQGDDHLRLIKSTLQNTFQNFNCFIVASDTGNSNTYSISSAQYPSTTYMDTLILMRSNQTNTGNAFFKINSLSPIPLLDAGGSQLPANSLKNGSIYMVAISSSVAYLLNTFNFSSVVGHFIGTCPNQSITDNSQNLANTQFVWDAITFVGSSTMQWFSPLYAYASSKLMNIL